MDTLSKDLDLMKSNDWTIILDLSNAYLQVPIFKKYKQYLRFYIQWKTLCFGPRAAPRVSTNIVSIIAALLRSQNIRVAVFLGDWFLVNQSQILSSRSRKMSQSVDFTGVYNKHRKVKCSTHIVFSLSRGQFDLAQ